MSGHIEERRISDLLLLAFMALSLVSCILNVATVPRRPETLPSEFAATTKALPTIIETPLDTPLPPIRESMRNKWQRLDTTGGGRQTAIATHPANPDIVYMASDNGGLFKTENGGDSWFSVSSNLGAYRLGFVTLDPLDPEVVYVTASTDYGAATSGGTTGEIYRSLNGGLSWEFVCDDMGFQTSAPSQASIVIPHDPAHARRFDRDGDNLSDVIVVGAWTGSADPPVGGIWRSEDEGQTFIHVTLKYKNVTALRAFEGDVNVLFVATHEGKVYRSEDLGENWVNITGDLPWARLSDLAVHPTDKDTLYVTCHWCQPDRPPVWKTTDSGRSWRAASEGLNWDEIGGFPSILMDRFDPNTLYVTTHKAPSEIGGVHKSTDGGSSWQLMPARLVMPDGRPYYWYQFEGKLTIGQAIDGRLFSGDDGGWRYPDGDPTDDSEEWEPATLGIGNVRVNTIDIDPLDDNVLYQGISDFGPYKSVDQGRSFHRILGDGWPVTVDNYAWTGPYYRNYKYCQLRCSSTCKEKGWIGSGGTTDFAISRQDSNVVFSAFGSSSGRSEHGGVNRSTDAGRTWQPVGFQLKDGFDLNPETCVPYGFRHLAIHPTDDNVLFAAMEIPASETGKLYRTVDGGVTWSTVYPTSSYITGIEVSAVDPDLVIFTTQSDVYKSERGGEAGSWQVITPPGVARVQTVGLSPHNTQVYVIGTMDQGIYYTADGGLSWQNHMLEDLFEQRLYQGSEQYLDAEIATASNPNAYLLHNVSAIVFDPIVADKFYIAGSRYSHASFGVAEIIHAGHNWQRLPLEGLSHRNVYDLAIDASGEILYAGTFDGTFKLSLGELDRSISKRTEGAKRKTKRR